MRNLRQLPSHGPNAVRSAANVDGGRLSGLAGYSTAGYASRRLRVASFGILGTPRASCLRSTGANDASSRPTQRRLLGPQDPTGFLAAQRCRWPSPWAVPPCRAIWHNGLPATSRLQPAWTARTGVAYARSRISRAPARTLAGVAHLPRYLGLTRHTLSLIHI